MAHARSMTSLPSALVALATLMTVGGLVVTTGPSPATRAWGTRTPNGTVTAQAGPRPPVTVLLTGPRAESPPSPARGPVIGRSAPPGLPATGSSTTRPPTDARPLRSLSATPTPTPRSARTPDAPGLYSWPLPGRPSVLRVFAVGPAPWSPGHRGVDLSATTTEVLAAGTGTIAFAGSVAGRGVVVVRHDGGLRTTYEPVTPSTVVGQVVTRGMPIGTIQAGIPHCASGPCLHWGALVADHYLDPLTLLHPVRRLPPVLLPLGNAPQ